jgi:NAD(P)H-hydrate epimerase
MIRVLTPAEMRAADADACAASGDVALMRNAGRAVAEYVRRALDGGRVVAFAGPGNNGGDAFAALAELGPSFEAIVYAEEAERPSAARLDAQERARAAGVSVRPLPDDDDGARAALAGARIALDGLFGTGSRLPVAARFAAAVRALDCAQLPVVAIDIPSGIDAATGAIDVSAVRASATVALAALKPGMLLEPGRGACGEIWLADIGIDDATLRARARTFAAMDDAEFLASLPGRARTADKRSAGAPLVIAGSAQFPGAAVLCALAAARAGAGYVTVAAPESAVPVLRAHLLEPVVVTLGDGPAAGVAADLAGIATRNSAVAIGPGLALDPRTGEIVRAFVEACELPLVIDASGLFHFGKHLDVLAGRRVVITPHAGEFARISGLGTVAEGTRVARVREFVERTGITTLLKGRDTLIYDGVTMHVNPTGTSALATAGSGDVLTGIIATLLAQGLEPADAARTAAFWHGRAASWCERERPRGIMAGDIPPALGPTLRSITSSAGALRCVYV